MTLESFIAYGLLFMIAGIFISIISFFTYMDWNKKHCEKLEEGYIPQFFRIVRNGDGTISLERKELFNLWNRSYIKLGDYHISSIEDYPVYENEIKKQIDSRIAKAQTFISHREELKRLAKKQINLPHVSYSKPQ